MNTTDTMTKTEKIDIAITTDCDAWKKILPTASGWIERATHATLEWINLPEGPLEISFLLTDDRTIQNLNQRYRNQDKPTNVLSFAALDGEEEDFRPTDAPLILGDVILAFETVEKEALEQGIPLSAHVIHLTVHGTLHLLGYDHLEELEALEMESLEANILSHLGIANPYA